MNIDDCDYLADIVNANTPKEIDDNLYIFRKDSIPNKDKLLEIMQKSFDFFDIFIIDHLHYLSLDDRDERSGLSDIIQAVKKATDIVRKPVIMVSHLSGSYYKEKRVPTTYDLHGSTNI